MSAVPHTLLQTIVCVVATLVVCACLAIWSAAAAEPARAVIERLDSTLLTNMKEGGELGFAGRYEKLAPRVDDDFDLRAVARRRLGAQWPRLDGPQQQAYLARLRQATIASYAQRFDRHQGERFAITATHDLSPARRRVDTVIVDNQGRRQPISYRLANRNGKWRIVNVIGTDSGFAGPSGNEAAVLRRGGPSALLASLDRRLQRYPALPKV